MSSFHTSASRPHHVERTRPSVNDKYHGRTEVIYSDSHQLINEALSRVRMRVPQDVLHSAAYRSAQVFAMCGRDGQDQQFRL